MTTRSLLPALPLLLLPLVGCDDDSSSEDPADATSGSTTDATSDPSDPSAGDPTANPSSPTTDPGTTTDDPGTSGPSTDSDDETGDPTTDPTDPTETGGETEGAGPCGEEGVPCEDAMILDLGLVGGTVSVGAVGNTADGDGWTSTVDATAGGIIDAPSNPWIYLRFTDDGLEKVELDDLQALTSEDWDIAAKRFGVRLNSGTSGPGCVTVAMLPDEAFDTLDAAPDDADYRAEAFYDASCGIIDDGSGAGGANYALTPWWFYPGCVGVTYVPFVIETGEGRHVKFMVESYYESGQAECNESGSMGSGSANFVWRWAFLD